MAKYRKLPVEIEAVQWLNGKVSEVTPWISEALNKNPLDKGAITRIGDKIMIATLEGEMTAIDGDYIIRGINGELYPCKPDIFKLTYECAGECKNEDSKALPLNIVVQQRELLINFLVDYYECYGEESEIKKVERDVDAYIKINL
jgi:hypothetical protein